MAYLAHISEDRRQQTALQHLVGKLWRPLLLRFATPEAPQHRQQRYQISFVKEDFGDFRKLRGEHFRRRSVPAEHRLSAQGRETPSSSVLQNDLCDYMVFTYHKGSSILRKKATTWRCFHVRKFSPNRVLSPGLRQRQHFQSRGASVYLAAGSE